MYITTAIRLSEHLKWYLEPDSFRPGSFTLLLTDECHGPENRSLNLFGITDLTIEDAARLADGLALALRAATDQTPAELPAVEIPTEDMELQEVA